MDEYGYSVRARDAMRAESLLVRYRVLSEVLDLSGKRVPEVGCGFGDLGASIDARYKGVAYTRIDISARMIEVGTHVHPELDLHYQDVLTSEPIDAFDVVLARGIFYLLGDGPESEMCRLIRKMFQLAARAVAFCTISTWAPAIGESEFPADPCRTMVLCRQLTPYVVLRHDYLPQDFAVYLYRTPRSEAG